MLTRMAVVVLPGSLLSTAQIPGVSSSSSSSISVVIAAVPAHTTVDILPLHIV